MSPDAILRPYGAPGNFIPCIDTDGTFFRVTVRPPNRLPDPGSTISVVPPASRAVSKPGSCGQIECSIHTCAVMGEVISLTSLCASTVSGWASAPQGTTEALTHGVTHLPRDSTAA